MAINQARLGVLRLNAGRLGGLPSGLVITIEGAFVTTRVRRGLTIRDLLADTPNTCSFTIEAPAPSVGEEVVVGLGDTSSDNRLFAGTIDSVTAIYEGLPANRAWAVTCQDHTFAFNRRKVRRRYLQQAADLIALDLLARYAPSGYSGSSAIVSPLPVVEGGIDFTEVDLTECFARLAQRIGGYWYIDYDKRVHLFLTEATTPPDPLVAGTRTLLNTPPINRADDLTQIRTRVYVEGGGGQARIPVAAGSTVLPITDASWYSGTGGLVVSGPQRIRYTGKGLSGGPAPPTATADLSAGTLSGGPYSYKASLVVQGSEGTLSAASNVVTIGSVAAPMSAPTATVISTYLRAPVTVAMSSEVVNLGNGGLGAGSYSWWLTFTSATGETDPTGMASVSTGTTFDLFMHGIPFAPSSATGRKVYRTTVNGAAAQAQLRYVWAVDSPIEVIDGGPDSILSGQPFVPSTNTTGSGGGMAPGAYTWIVSFTTALGETGPSPAVSFTLPSAYMAATLSAIPTSADPRVIGRKVWRTKYNAPGVYYLEATIADNTTTSVQVGKPDANLGAVFGGGGTAGGSGRIQLTNIPTGQTGNTNARKLYRTPAGGSLYKLVTTINDNVTTTYIDNTADASLGEQHVDEGLSELTGIPASGDGAIVWDILKGDDVNILMQIDDVPAQQALAASEGAPSDGIVEHYIQDRRLGQAQATATGKADLVLFSRPLQTVQYACRDPKTRSGKTISINLPEIGIVGSYTIQSVDISEIDIGPGLYPLYRVSASSVMFRLEDVIRRLQLEV